MGFYKKKLSLRAQSGEAISIGYRMIDYYIRFVYGLCPPLSAQINSA